MTEPTNIDPTQPIGPQPVVPPQGEQLEPTQPAPIPYLPPQPPMATEPERYSPTPEPRPDWSRPEYADPASQWPVAAPAQPELRPVEPAAPKRRAGVGVGTVFATSLIAAVLASGGTYLAISASGALDQTTPGSATPTGQPAATKQPVTIDESSAIIDVASKVGPAVVKITSEAAASSNDPFSIPATGVGSGVIYDSDGWILTNHHVVAGSDSLTVQLADGHEYKGTIYGIDTLTDLAIVKIDATGLPTAALGDSDAVEVGQLTVAIGSPLGTYSNTVTSGILSARGRSIQVEGGTLNNLLQTDTAINPGNSGGPLLDSGGNIIGINTAIASSAEGIGFAIPINLAKPIMAQAVAGTPLARPYIGVRFQTIDLQLAESKNLSVTEGALLDDAQGPDGQTLPAIVSGGPAEKAGLKAGDIVTAINGTKLDSEHPLDAVVSQYGPGDTVTLTVLRDGASRDISVTLGTRPTN